jgi:hypothetical protein
MEWKCIFKYLTQSQLYVIMNSQNHIPFSRTVILSYDRQVYLYFTIKIRNSRISISKLITYDVLQQIYLYFHCLPVPRTMRQKVMFIPSYNTFIYTQPLQSNIGNGTPLMPSVGFPLKNWRLWHVWMKYLLSYQAWQIITMSWKSPICKQL